MREYFNDFDFNTGELIRAIEKTSKCRCTYLKCPRCGRSKDNLNNLLVIRAAQLERELSIAYGIIDYYQLTYCNMPEENVVAAEEVVTESEVAVEDPAEANVCDSCQ